MAMIVSDGSQKAVLARLVKPLLQVDESSVENIPVYVRSIAYTTPNDLQDYRTWLKSHSCLPTLRS